MRSSTVDARLEGLSGGQLLDLAAAAVARHAADGAVDGAALLGLANVAVGAAGGQPLDEGIDAAGLRASVVGWHRLEARVAAEKLRRLRAVEQRRAWTGEALSTRGWATNALALTRSEARAQVDTAVTLARMPRVEARLTAGEITLGHAIEAARSLDEAERVRTHPEPTPGQQDGSEQNGDPDPAATSETAGAQADAGDLAGLLDEAAAQAPTGDRRQLRRRLDTHADRHTGMLATREQRARARRRVWVGCRPDGDGGIEGDLTPTAAAKGRLVLHALARNHPAGDPRSFQQRCHDALERLFDWAIAEGRLPDQAGEPPRVLLTLTPEHLHHHPTRPERPGTRHDGGPGRADTPALLDGYGEVSGATARMLCCDAEITPVVLTSSRDALHVGRDRRRPNRAQRRAAFARDRGCVRCRAPLAYCQIHHVLWPWHTRGRTDIDVLVTVCWDCHALIHHCGWQVHRRADGSYTIRPPDPQTPAAGPDPGQAALRVDPPDPRHPPAEQHPPAERRPDDPASRRPGREPRPAADGRVRPRAREGERPPGSAGAPEGRAPDRRRSGQSEPGVIATRPGEPG